jgi:hypothetical protein
MLPYQKEIKEKEVVISLLYDLNRNIGTLNDR